MRRLALVSTSALLLVAGCSSSAHRAAPTSTPSVPAVETPSPTPSPTASPTASPTPTPTPTRAVPAADRDVDGDGKPDAIRATSTLLSVELSSTGKTVTAPVHADSPTAAAVLGTADVDRDGRAEVFLQTAEGASTQFVTPYRFDGTTLRELQLDGGPARLGIGGSATHGDGFRCPSGLLEVLGAESQDGTTYIVHLDDYRLTGSQLVLVRSSQKTVRQGDPLVEASYRPDCGSVSNGG